MECGVYKPGLQNLFLWPCSVEPLFLCVCDCMHWHPAFQFCCCVILCRDEGVWAGPDLSCSKQCLNWFLKVHSEPCTADFCEGRLAFWDKIKMFELRLSSVKSSLFLKLPSQCIDSSFRNIESFRISLWRSLFCPYTSEILCFLSFLFYSFLFPLLPSPSYPRRRTIFQLSSHSFRNFTTGAFPLSSLKKAINLACLNPDLFKLPFTKTWCTAFFCCLNRLFKHLPQMYLLVDWYTLYMGVDREWGVFVSLYGPGTSNGCHMAKENVGKVEKKKEKKNPADLCSIY